MSNFIRFIKTMICFSVILPLLLYILCLIFICIKYSEVLGFLKEFYNVFIIDVIFDNYFDFQFYIFLGILAFIALTILIMLTNLFLKIENISKTSDALYDYVNHCNNNKLLRNFGFATSIIFGKILLGFYFFMICLIYLNTAKKSKEMDRGTLGFNYVLIYLSPINYYYYYKIFVNIVKCSINGEYIISKDKFNVDTNSSKIIQLKTYYYDDKNLIWRCCKLCLTKCFKNVCEPTFKFISILFLCIIKIILIISLVNDIINSSHLVFYVVVASILICYYTFALTHVYYDGVDRENDSKIWSFIKNIFVVIWKIIYYFLYIRCVNIFFI